MPFTTPSGTLYGDLELDILHRMHQAGSIRRQEKPFTFRSGIQSHINVFLRDDVTENPSLQARIGVLLRNHILRSWGGIKTPCLIGVPTAGTPFASAASIASYYEGSRIIAWRQMREKKKESHGASQGWTNRPPTDDYQYGTIEQVTSTGESLCAAITRLGEDSYPIANMRHIIFIDWELGGPKFLASQGFSNVNSLFKMRDVAHAYHYLRLWDTRMVDEVHGIVEKHQSI